MTKNVTTLSARLLVSFGLMTVLMAGIGVTGWRISSYFASEFDTLYHRHLVAAVQLSSAEDALWRLRYGFPQFMVLGPEERKQIIDEEAGHYQKIEDALKAYGQGERTPEEQAALNEFLAVFHQYTGARPKWFALQLEGKTQEAAEWRAQTTTPHGAAAVKGLGKLIQLQRAVAESKKADVERVAGVTLPAFLAVSLILSVALGWWVSRSVIRQLSTITSALAAATTELETASREQEGTVAHQASGIEEVSRTVMSLAESATHISDTASGVLANAERARETTELTAGRITELNNHTSRMSEILEVIREIADRTDLLALNASLEATRAGDEGRSFSLLASEMRKLAERVTHSVQDVKALIVDVRASGSSTVMATEEARKLADGTTESARQITLVTQQQRTATERVADTMRSITTALNQALAAAKQTRAGAGRLREQVTRLTTMVGQKNGARAEP